MKHLSYSRSYMQNSIFPSISSKTISHPLSESLLNLNQLLPLFPPSSITCPLLGKEYCCPLLAYLGNSPGLLCSQLLWSCLLFQGKGKGRIHVGLTLAHPERSPILPLDKQLQWAATVSLRAGLAPPPLNRELPSGHYVVRAIASPSRGFLRPVRG